MRSLFFAALAAIVLSLSACDNTGFTFQPTRLFDTQTRLGVFESRIAGVVQEFIRRSPEFRETWTEFKTCMRSADCDPAPILKRRDEIIAAEWPIIFDRLLYENDWGAAARTELNKEEFFSELKYRGKNKLRNSCTPLIGYLKLPLGQFIYELPGYNCGGRYRISSSRAGVFLSPLFRLL